MPVDLKIARPFVYSAADGVRYEFGCGLYPAMDDAFAADWFVQHHCEAEVIKRGPLVQQRQLLGLDLAGNYVPLGHIAPIALDPTINPQYEQGIVAGWAPLFAADLDSFGDLDRLPTELPSGSKAPAPGGAHPACLGFDAAARAFSVARHTDEYLAPTVRMFPGDPSPPVNRGGKPIDRSGEQVNDPRFAVPAARLYPPTEPNDPAPIPIPPAPPSAYYSYSDPRQ
jgi:hypothetical protein